MDYVALKSEIDADPKSLGYADHANDNDTDNQWVADKLNEIGASGETLIQESVETKEVIEQLVWSEISDDTKFTRHKKDVFNIVIGGGLTINPSNTNIQNALKGVFDNTNFPLTRANMIALATYSVSRAAKLEWPIITKSDIHNARIA